METALRFPYWSGSELTQHRVPGCQTRRECNINSRQRKLEIKVCVLTDSNLPLKSPYTVACFLIRLSQCIKRTHKHTLTHTHTQVLDAAEISPVRGHGNSRGSDVFSLPLNADGADTRASRPQSESTEENKPGSVTFLSCGRVCV